MSKADVDNLVESYVKSGGLGKSGGLSKSGAALPAPQRPSSRRLLAASEAGPSSPEAGPSGPEEVQEAGPSGSKEGRGRGRQESLGSAGYKPPSPPCATRDG